MTFTTYAGLKAEVSARVRNSRADDSTLSGCVSLAEAEMNRTLRSRRQVARVVAVISDELSAVPTDFAAPKVMKVNSPSKGRVRIITSQQMAAMKDELSSTPTGRPAYASVEGEEFEYYPIPDGDYDVELTYYQKVPALSDAAPSNWVLADHPDLYLAGGLWQAFAFLKNAEMATLWEAKFRGLMEAINGEAIDSAYGDELTPIPSQVIV